MAKTKPKSKTRLIKKLSYIAGGILVLIALLYIARGWLRMTVEPKTIGLFYKNSVKKLRNDESQKLGDPFKTLGFSSLQTNTGECSDVTAKHFASLIECSYSQHAYKQIPTDQTAKDSLNAAAAELQQKLQANGWANNYDVPPRNALTKLIKALTSGDDAQPGASYQKQIGKVMCSFDVTAASTKPAPVAMAADLICSRSYMLFGSPY